MTATATAASRAWVTSRGGAVVIEQIDAQEIVIKNTFLSRAAPKCGYGLDSTACGIIPFPRGRGPASRAHARPGRLGREEEEEEVDG